MADRFKVLPDLALRRVAISNYDDAARRKRNGIQTGRAALFHCHQQLHMDFGLMTLFEYT
jgi:FtsP/CotA-like multicopper oxidase with cupredoxin domain